MGENDILALTGREVQGPSSILSAGRAFSRSFCPCPCLHTFLGLISPGLQESHGCSSGSSCLALVCPIINLLSSSMEMKTSWSPSPSQKHGVCTYVYMPACGSVCLHGCIYTCLYAYVGACTCMQVCVLTQVSVYMVRMKLAFCRHGGVISSPCPHSPRL